MDQNTSVIEQAPVAAQQEPSSAPQVTTIPIAQRMAECKSDRQALAAELTPMFQEVFGEALKCLETALPKFREPGTADARLHAMLRHRILGVGNGKIRELEQVLKNYFVVQVFERTVVFKMRVDGSGPANLPPSIAQKPQ